MDKFELNVGSPTGEIDKNSRNTDISFRATLLLGQNAEFRAPVFWSVGCLCPYFGHFSVDFKNSKT